MEGRGGLAGRKGRLEKWSVESGVIACGDRHKAAVEEGEEEMKG